MYLLIKDVPTCPSSTQSLLALATKWQLSSFASWSEPGLLHTYPETISATVATFPFVISGLAFNVSTTGAIAIGKSVALQLATEVAQGYVFTNNPTTGQHLDSLVGYKNSTTATATAAITVIPGAASSPHAPPEAALSGLIAQAPPDSLHSTMEAVQQGYIY